MARKSIGERVSLVRKQRGLSLPDLAKLTGIKFQNLWRLEHGGRAGHVRSDTLIKLCQALGVSADRLLGLDDPTDEEDVSAA